jgi:hypothetical protein
MEMNVENDVQVEEALQAITLIIPISEGGLIESVEKLVKVMLNLYEMSAIKRSRKLCLLQNKNINHSTTFY